MIRKLGPKKYVIYTERKNPKTGQRRRMVNRPFTSRAAAKRKLASMHRAGRF
jgi:cell division septation protein DedD